MKVLHSPNLTTYDITVLLRGIPYATMYYRMTKRIEVKKISVKALNELIARGYIVILK